MTKQWSGQGLFTTSEGDLEGPRAVDIEVINAGLQQILNTSPGERAMLPEFGSKLQNFLFQPLDETLKQVIKTDAFLAIERWEPRIEVLELDVFEDNDNEHRLLVHVLYRLVEGNQELQQVDLVITKNKGEM